MTWFFLSFLTAFFEAVKDAFGKQSLKQVDEYVVSWTLSFLTGFFLLPLVIISGFPQLGNQFWLALIFGGTLNSITSYLYIKAIKVSDLSITLPMIALTPLFMLITSPLMVGEWPNLFDFLGIFLLVTGSYLLNIKEKSKGYLAPFRALWVQKGPKLMLIVALIWSITSNFDKIGVQNSSPIFWLFAMFSFITVLLLPMLLYKTPNPRQKILKGLPILLPMGLFCSLSVMFQMEALTLTNVVQVIAIKRTSVVMGVMLGYLIFKEKGMKERLTGTLIMLLGVIIMTLF
ncbi:MAG TPA: EamA family transporter [Halomicronema sp.]